MNNSDLIPISFGEQLMDLWQAVGCKPEDLDDYVDRNGIAETWARLLHHVRILSGEQLCQNYSWHGEKCELLEHKEGPCHGKKDLTEIESLPIDEERYEPTRWYRILNPHDGSLWMETSDYVEVYNESMTTGWEVERLFEQTVNPGRVWNRVPTLSVRRRSACA